MTEACNHGLCRGPFVRIIILIVVALILLLGGGGAAWWFLMGPGAEKTEEVIAEITKPDPIYLTLNPPFVISLIQEGEVTHHLTMQITLLLANEFDLPATSKRMPLLRDALLTQMHSLYSMRVVRNAGFDSDLVKEQLMAVCERELGKGVVSDILIREIERSQPRQS